jgi:hypothetical protein
MSDVIVNSRLSFSIARHVRWSNPPWGVTPSINDVPLTELVARYEVAEKFEPPLGGYGALLPEIFDFGPLDRYFLGKFKPGSYFEHAGFYLLGCHCGELGCWPLKCQIKIANRNITWHGFNQPHRRERDYLHFGPFVFDSHQYKQALSDLCTDYASRLSADRV